ncbi:DUF58 domain-containing protein [Saccharibacillus brassicae]|uniref:DUF58 domain-containing protein n=1 Tax=Saccharibacillus brassicae TaxID=2583377 RepID=A0A4Y6V2C5_SACBS|nr:DUF58 domain-containing protein [Saccharibacillus brassicae]QDH22405.1 DUF58 domain-containing protein [Saccharibacillus brassicae]
MKPEQLLGAEWTARLDRLTLSTARRVRGTRQGRRRSRELGASLEFADYREYSPGDDVRRFDWSVYGRTGRKVVRQYLDEQELQVTLYLDCSQSMAFADEGAPTQSRHASHLADEPAPTKLLHASRLADESPPTKLLHASRLAASVGYMALAGYDRLGVYRVGARVGEGLPLLRGRPAVHRMLNFLAASEPEGRGDLAEAFGERSRLPKLPGMAWVFSDCWTERGEEELEEALARLQAARQEVVLVQVVTRGEIEPRLSGDLKLIDAELGTAKEAALTGRLLEAYEREFAAYRGRLAEFCARRGIAYVLAPTDVPVREIVLGTLREQGWVR